MRADPASANLLRDHPVLFRRIVEFNSQPATYLHESRRDAMQIPHADTAVWTDSRTHSHVSTWILQHIGLKDRWHLDPFCAAWPIALLPSERVDLLARHIGAVLAWPRFRHSVNRDEVKGWQDCLSVEAFEFAAASAALLPQETEEPATADDAVKLGYGAIAEALAGCPEEVRLRAELKLPKTCKARSVEKHRGRLAYRVLNAMDPRWVSSFPKAKT